MSKYGNSYSGNDFLEWWKTHYGTDYDGKSGIVKTEGMTDEDVAIGKSLLNSYNEQQLLTKQYNENVATETDKYNSLIESSDKAYDSQLAGAQAEYDTSAKLLLDNYNKNSATAKDIYDRNTAELLANYGTAQDALDKSKRQSQQNASITLDKLKKYLPSQIKAQGLGGLGVSESSMLQAYNNYNSEMGSIESGYQESKTNLDTNYNTNKNAYDTAYQETQGSLDEMYGQSKANLDNSFNTTKVNLESAKSQASDTFKAQLADSLAKLKQGYDAGIFASDKDANGNLLVDNVLQEYAKMLSEENDRIANEDKAIKENQYKIESNNIEIMYQSMIGDDGKISQADYNELAKYVTEKGTPLGDNYLALLNSQLNGYSGMIRDEASQDALDKQTAMATPTVNNGITIVGSPNSANDDHGDNFEIKYNGTPYKVEKGYDASDNLNRKLMDAYTSSVGFAPTKGAVMIYNGRIYMYLENNDANQDRWCVIQQRRNTYASHFADLCKALGLTVYSRDYKDD